MTRFTPAKKSFLIAFVLYALLLLTGYIWYTSTLTKKALPELTEVPITLSMFQVAPPTPKRVEVVQPAPIKAVEPPPLKPIEKRPAPIEKPSKPPIKKPVEPATKTPIKISPPPKPTIEPVIEVQPKAPPPIPAIKSAEKPVAEPLEMPSSPIRTNQAAKAEERYLSELNAIIAQHAYNSYPKRAKRRNWQGDVFIQFTLEPNGRISQLSIVESSGRKLLDNAALQIFQVKMNQQFKPFPKEITRTKWRIKVPVSYNLR